jgi:hypothetical protein
MAQNKTPQQKRIDTLVGAAYHKACSGLVVNIMDLGKIMAEGRKLLAEGVTEERLCSGLRAFTETLSVKL